VDGILTFCVGIPESLESQIKDWIQGDAERMRALQIASTLQLNDWCIAAGFVRNLVWETRMQVDGTISVAVVSKKSGPHARSE